MSTNTVRVVMSFIWNEVIPGICEGIRDYIHRPLRRRLGQRIWFWYAVAVIVLAALKSV